MAKLSEAAFQKQVIDLAHLYRWRVAHFRPARTTVAGKETWRTAVSADGQGFPDLVLARNGVVLFRELKTDHGKASHEQLAWLLAVGGAIWRPAQWSTIEREIRELGHPPKGTFCRPASTHTTGNS
jgi:hypothetical protein